MIAHIFKRGICYSLATVLVSLTAQAASVFVQFPPAGLIMDPMMASSAGAGYSVSAVLQPAMFTGLSAATAPAGGSSSDNSFTHAGINQLTLTNTMGVPITIQAGAFVGQLDGTFSFTPGGDGQSAGGAGGSAILQVTHSSPLTGSAIYIASVGLDPTTSYVDGIIFQAFDGNLSLTQSNGASVNVIQADNSALIANLLMPAITLQPDDFIDIMFVLSTVAGANNGAGAIADFMNTASLSLTLPAGAFLTSDASVPLDWIHTAAIPLPPAFWLLGWGLAVVVAVARRREGSSRVG